MLKKAQSSDWALIFSDEASFRQDSNLVCHLESSWPSAGKSRLRVSVSPIKILGAIELFQTRFHYRQDTVFKCFHLSGSWSNWRAATGGKEPF